MKHKLLLSAAMLCSVAAFSQTYLSADFESGLPAGWSVNPASGAWAVGNTAAASSQGFAPPAHTSFAYINDDASASSANSNSMLVSPVINLSAATSVYITYESYFGGQTYQSATEQTDLMVSVDGGNTWTVAAPVPASTAWQTNGFNLSSLVAGQANVKIAFRYNDGGGWLYGCAIDNVTLLAPPAWDAELSAVYPFTGSPSACGGVGSPMNLTGTITNTGASAITSVVVKYRLGANVYPMTLSSINIAPFATYNFTHSTPLNIPVLGPNTIDMWVELTSDANNSNDTLQTVIEGVSFLPPHHIVVEEGTGTWCGWCVRGAVYLDSMHLMHPNDAHLIAVHNGDPMVVTAYDAGIGTLISGYPSTLVNRATVSDPQDIFTDYNNSINDFGFATLAAAVTYNSSTRLLTVNASANFAVNLNGDYRLALVATEDGVTGTASGYNQANYYSGGNNGPMGGFENLPNPVPAAQMVYNHVAREILGGFSGQSGSLPTAIVAGTPYSHTFTWTIPATYNVSNMHLVLMLIDNDATPNRILNATGASVVTGVIETPASLGVVSVFPNPSLGGNFTLTYDLVKEGATVITVTDLLGNTVQEIQQGTQQTGSYRYDFNTSGWAAGSYFVSVTTPEGRVTRRVQVME